MHKYSLRRKWFSVYSCWSSSCLGDLWGREEFLLLGTQLMDLYDTSHIENSSFYWRNEAWWCCPQPFWHSRSIRKGLGLQALTENSETRYHLLGSSPLLLSIKASIKWMGNPWNYTSQKEDKELEVFASAPTRKGHLWCTVSGNLFLHFPLLHGFHGHLFGVPFISTLSRYSSLVLWNDTQVGNE